VSFPDALSVGPWAFKTQSPVLLVGADGRLSQSSVDAVRSDPVGFDRVIIVGGTAVVSDAVRGQLGEGLTFVRLAGPDRYATSVAWPNGPQARALAGHTPPS
jgi:putative cell wall-binding protein